MSHTPRVDARQPDDHEKHVTAAESDTGESTTMWYCKICDTCLDGREVAWHVQQTGHSKFGTAR